MKGLIFSGGPSSVGNENAPEIKKFVYKLNIPILGVCYGLQLICRDFGGEVKLSNEREFEYKFIGVKIMTFLLTQNCFFI